jgi:hypothetical protein
MILYLAACLLFVVPTCEIPKEDTRTGLALQAEPPEIDLGQMAIGSEKEFRAVLRNTSNSTVSVANIRSNCECIDLHVSRLILEPGVTTEISGRFRAGPRAGPIHKRAILEVRGPDLRRMIIPFRGAVVATLVIEPEAVTLHPHFADGKAAESSVTIRNTGPHVVQLSRGPVVDRIALDLDRDTLRPGESTTARIRAKAEFVCAEVSRVTINTDHPDEKALHVGLTVVPTPQLQLAPKVLRLGSMTTKDFLAKPPYKIMLWGPGLQEFQVTSIHCPSFLRAELPQQGDKNQTILLHPCDRFSQQHACIDIVVEHKSTRKSCALKIPVSGIIGDAN